MPITLSPTVWKKLSRCQSHALCHGVWRYRPFTERWCGTPAICLRNSIYERPWILPDNDYDDYDFFIPSIAIVVWVMLLDGVFSSCDVAFMWFMPHQIWIWQYYIRLNDVQYVLNARKYWSNQIKISWTEWYINILQWIEHVSVSSAPFSFYVYT